jgi:hypothetical protein
MEIHKNEKNENTAFVLMLGVLSEKMTEIINLLEDSNKKIEFIKNDLETVNSQKKELKEKKFYMPLTNEDYD